MHGQKELSIPVFPSVLYLSDGLKQLFMARYVLMACIVRSTIYQRFELQGN